MNKFFVFGIVLFFGLSCSQLKKVKKQDVVNKPPSTYIAYHTSESIVIDGDSSDDSWQKAAWTEVFIDIEGVKKAKYKTQAKMLWDDTYFYILAKLEEPHVWADIKKHDAIIFHNNDFEVFVDPDGDSHSYYELEINALNTTWDLFISKPYRELNNVVLNDWEINGLKSAIKVDGTLNNPNDIDKGWVVEMAIPWSVYKTSYFQDIVPKDKFWRVNFSRVNWNHTVKNGVYSRKRGENSKYLPEYNWVWSPQGVVNMHEPEKWGYVFFSSKKVGEQDYFIIPKDEKIKWKLFEMYRKQKRYFNENKKWIIKLDSLTTKEFIIHNKQIKPILESHSQGWNIIVKSPFSGNQIIIREDGKLIVKK